MVKTPWEEIGVDVSEADGLADAMTVANVMFNVSVRQGYFIPSNWRTSGGDQKQKAENYYYIVRDDINAVLGACKSKFQPLQNADAFAFFSPLIEDGICKIDTIGSFGLGQKVWMLAKVLDSKYKVVEGDSLSLYLLLINAHDGSSSVMVGLVPIRIVCSNMFSMLGKSEFHLVKFKHTGDPAEKLKKVLILIEDQLRRFGDFVQELSCLTKVWPLKVELDTYFRYVFKIAQADISTKLDNKIKRLKELFILGQGNQQEGVRGTWYAAYNAVSEYLNYEAGRTTETRINSLWFGVNNNINQLALTAAIQMSQGAIVLPLFKSKKSKGEV